jgi:two-component system chemotaxis response regulator CheY
MSRVLSVGQCGLDHSVLSRYLRRHFGAEVVAVSTEEDAIRRLESEEFDLILVNRRLDADGGDGIAVIRRLQASEFSPSPVMLVSNDPEAQSAAVEAGAVPGFGKAEYDNPDVLNCLARILGESGESG